MMEPDCLVDTDVFVDFLRGNEQATTFIMRHAEHIVLSAIVLAELYSGVRGEDELVELDGLARLFPVKDVDKEVVRLGGLLRQRYGKSHGVGLADALLAATAQRYGLLLKTLNTKHYPMFQGLEPAYPNAGA